VIFKDYYGNMIVMGFYCLICKRHLVITFGSTLIIVLQVKSSHNNQIHLSLSSSLDNSFDESGVFVDCDRFEMIISLIRYGMGVMLSWCRIPLIDEKLAHKR
jgi:hypothetical protein